MRIFALIRYETLCRLGLGRLLLYHGKWYSESLNIKTSLRIKVIILWSNEHVQLYDVHIPILLNIKNTLVFLLRRFPIPQFYNSPCKEIVVFKKYKVYQNLNQKKISIVQQLK